MSTAAAYMRPVHDSQRPALPVLPPTRHETATDALCVLWDQWEAMRLRPTSGPAGPEVPTRTNDVVADALHEHAGQCWDMGRLAPDLFWQVVEAHAIDEGGGDAMT